MHKEYAQTADQVLSDLQSGPEGLSAAQADGRLAEYGPNRLREAPKATLLQRFLQQLRDPMLLILMAAAAVSAVTNYLSHEPFTEVLIILAVVLLNAVLGVIQESKAEAAIEALQTMTAATSKVLRDGAVAELESSRLVPGDVVLLEAGDAVPADGRLLACASLQIEEAALTGESVPSAKSTDPLTGDVSLGDRRNMAYMGSTVSYGRGRMVVTATGMDTEMGKIAGVLARTEQEETPLQKKLTQLGKTLSWLVLGICVFIFVFDLLVAGDFSLSGILKTFMVAVSLAVAAIPEGLATVVTVVLSIGVTRMSRRNAVIRRLTAVETLGCTQVICSDKTGTLTQNKMTVVDHTGDAGQLAAAMALCSDAVQNPDGTVRGEPTEAALVSFAAQCGLPKPRLEQDSPRIAEAPFDSGRKMMSTVHRTEGGYVQFTKGGPDVVLECCTGYWDNGMVRPMTEEKRAEILAANKAMADKALRVLAAAQRTYETLPQSMEAADLEHDLCFLGLAGMIDPVRPEVKAAIEECRQAGIRPIMITGDHKETAVAIARQLNIFRPGDKAIDGPGLDFLPQEALEEEIERVSVYARVTPEHKLRIVQAWQKKGRVVAMTGDGVNDAPALRAADIGCAMGKAGTDVAKGAADMILTDDNFATVVAAVEQGRGIYANIRKAIHYLLSCNIGEILTIFLATVLPFSHAPLTPVQLLWLNLVTDSLPALALGMEPVERRVMDQPPRDPHEPLFSRAFSRRLAWQGILVGGITLLAYGLGLYLSNDYAVANTMAFATLTLSQLFHAFDVRSERTSLFRLGVFSNPAMNKAFLVGLLLQAAVLLAPPLQAAFSVVPLTLSLWGVTLGLALTPLIVCEIVKGVHRAAHPKTVQETAAAPH